MSEEELTARLDAIIERLDRIIALLEKATEAQTTTAQQTQQGQAKAKTKADSSVKMSLPVNAALMGLIDRVSNALNLPRGTIVRNAIRAFIKGKIAPLNHDIIRVEPINMTIVAVMSKDDIEKVKEASEKAGRDLNNFLRDIVFSYVITLQMALASKNEAAVKELLQQD